MSSAGSIQIAQPGVASRRIFALAALGLGQAGIYFTLALWDGYHQQPFPAILLILIAFTLYLASIGVAEGLSGRTALAIALGLAFLFRASLVLEPPFLTDDYYRYLWDGLVQTRGGGAAGGGGLNPFRYAPADPALAGIDDALRARVNNPTVPTIYPPLAQLVFLAVAALHAGWIGLKLVWLACDAAIAVLIYKLTPAQRRLQSWLIYAWSPLVVIEVAWNAHLDLLGVLPLVAAIGFAARKPDRPLATGLALALSTDVKYFAAALVPGAARVSKRPLSVLIAFTLAALALYIPYVSVGSGLFTGLGIFVDRWIFNAGVFELLLWLLRSLTAAKAVAAAIVLFIVAASVRNDWPLERTAFWVTGAILMLSPTVHPWYVLWMVPLIALRPNRAWLYLSGSVFLAYYGLGIYRTQGVWPEPLWLRAVIWGPFLVTLAIDSWRDSWLQTAVGVLRRSP